MPVRDGFVLVDVRTPAEFAEGHISGSVNIPVDELRTRLNELPRGKEIVAYCRVGQRGYLATRILMHADYRVRNLAGGYLTYRMSCPPKCGS
jgi:rhodanese-related sulfurtransferase